MSWTSTPGQAQSTGRNVFDRKLHKPAFGDVALHLFIITKVWVSNYSAAILRAPVRFFGNRGSIAAHC